jgi:glucose-1-phosphate cytidylyltransferase
MIKEFFAHYYLHESDVTFDFSSGSEPEIHRHANEPWKVTLVDTGLHTMTGGRVKRIRDYVNKETFMLTYGDGLSNVNIHDLIDFHRHHGKIITLTAVQPSGRFGIIDIDEADGIRSFSEKPRGDGSWINGGFFVIEPAFFDYLEDDTTVLEKSPLEKAAKDGELKAYKHYGFWQAMDKLSDKLQLESLWESGKAAWKMWD